MADVICALPEGTCKATVKTRNTVLYVNIDKRSAQHWDEHAGNKAGVEGALSEWKPGFSVRNTDVYGLQSLQNRSGMTVDEVFPDKSVFAIFSAGSFTEWEDVLSDQDWAKALAAYQGLLASGPAPVFAVCGSHQLVAASVNDWQAVSHMTTPPRPATGSPPSDWTRMGERGTYPIKLTASADEDVLIKKLQARKPNTQQMTYAIHHCDMVTDARGFVQLFTADGSRAPSPGTNPASKEAIGATARCQVQGMRRLFSDQNDRLFYSTQFHPEMPGFDGSADDHGWGRALLQAFFDLAEEYWTTRADS